MAGRGRDGPPSPREQAVISALRRRPARRFLARIARQVLAWRAGQRG